jgi:hypothetical protein
LRNDLADAMKVFQSSRLAGAKSLVPMGQLFLSLALYTSKQFSHFRSTLAEYLPESSTLLQTQPEGLPAFGVVEIFAAWQ